MRQSVETHQIREDVAMSGNMILFGLALILTLLSGCEGAPNNNTVSSVCCMICCVVCTESGILM